jgi:UDP-N-acetylglucosamine--N-acetylmuramyl-(pentapeptide) pyrophosphoryl-undecaprenol N-acetylglucosamine transferase
MATVVLAGGGTAGHIEPALAVARQWATTHPSDHLIFLGTSSGLETTLIPSANFPLHLIPRVRISRTPSFSWLKIPVDLFASVKSCGKVVKGADAVVGFGGYVSAPAYIAAKLSGVPIVIHEANAKPGWANRLGAFFTHHLAVAHPVEYGKFSSALLAGLPLRSDVAHGFNEAEKDWAKARRDAKVRLGFSENAPLVVIMGGSQGSVAIN